MQFDMAQAEDGSTDLKNFKISGDDIAIDGSISLDPEQHLKCFYFSDFSFDRLTHVEITATVRDGKVLEVEAHGPSYNGKQFFQSLFSAGQLAEDSEAADPFSVDLTARIGTVVGFYDTNLTDAQLTRRSGTANSSPECHRQTQRPRAGHGRSRQQQGRPQHPRRIAAMPARPSA